MKVGDVFVVYVNDWQWLKAKGTADETPPGYYIGICDGVDGDELGFSYQLYGDPIVDKKSVSAERWNFILSDTENIIED
jgi:hypothetical protein